MSFSVLFQLSPLCGRYMTASVSVMFSDGVLNINIKDIREVKEWLDQFEIPDLYLAEYMLKKMRYIGFEEFEYWLQTEVKGLLSSLKASNGKPETVAIFPITKSLINSFNENKEMKSVNDSSGRIGHALKNIERDLPRNIELSPRLESMKSNRVKHIVFVDDFIGTGERFIKFWKTVPKSIKSWHSRGWCKIWLVSFAAHESGINRILRQISVLDANHVRVNLRLGESFIKQNKDLNSLCRKYGERLSDVKAAVGFGNQLSPIVFQHGCPNNAPSIFWCTGKKSARSFFPLFPNRSVSESLYPLFRNEISLEETAEDLWIAGQYKLAVNFFDNIKKYNGRHEIITILSYIKSGKEINKIRSIMVMTDAEFNDVLGEIHNYGLIDEDRHVTRFGKDILLRGSRLKSIPIIRDKKYTNFYPATFLGFQREV